MPNAQIRDESVPDTALFPELADELEKVAALVREHCPPQTGNGEAMALLRLLPGVRPQDWELFASTYGLENWLALPLGGTLADSVTALLSLQTRLAFQRDHDALTGIGNRGFFNRRLSSEIARAIRSRNELSILYIDLDRFKQVNDTHGHACGDAVLQRLAQTLQSSVRHYDILARIGGEEFAVILPATSCWTAAMMGNRLLEAFRKENFTCGDSVFTTTFSGGVSSLALLAEDDRTEESLLASADKALYEAKNKGRANISIAVSEKMDKDRKCLVMAQEKQFLFSDPDSE